MSKPKPCRDIQDLLGPYLDGELDEPTSRRVESHLAGCATCRQELTALKALDGLVREKDTGPKLADDYWDWHRSQVWKKVRFERRARRQRSYYGSRFMWLRLAMVTAGAAVVFIAVIAGWRVLVRPGPSARHMVAESDLRKAEKDMDGMEVSALDKAAETEGVPSGMARRARASTAGKKLVQAKGGAGGYVADEEVPESRAEELGGADETGGLSGVMGAKAATGAATGIEDRSDVFMAEPVPEPLAAESADAEVAPVPKPEQPVAAVVPARRGHRPGPNEAERLEARDELFLRGAPGPMVESESCDQMPELVEVPRLPTVEPGDTATVVLRALVETDGTVSAAEVERSSGVELLDSIALFNVKQARFRAGLQDGNEVRCWVTVPQSFEADAVEESEPKENETPEDGD